MRVAMHFLGLAVLLSCYSCLASARSGHGKGWDNHESHWKKGGSHHDGQGHGSKYSDDDWDKWGKHGSHNNYDKGGHSSERFGKHHGGHDENRKHISGGEGHNSWGGHDRHGGKDGHHSYNDAGHKNKGFRNSYRKTERGDQSTYHDISNHESINKDYSGRDHWNKYGGKKFHNNYDGRSHFDEAERGGMHKGFGASGHSNHQGGVYNSGDGHHHKRWGENKVGGKHFNGHQEVGGHKYSSEYGGHH